MTAYTADYEAGWRDALHKAADDLRSCVTCGKPHTPRDVTYPAADGTRYEGISWADPTDNHPLLTRATWLTWGNTPSMTEWLAARAEQVNP